ncbi:TauD/TfdA family dioxygenase [Ochrobactrum sp. EDr1-4]|uniref:TauD/TfdA family dioxygenase n=1 Tax=Ochrobactrum sp. EDr1-4 TaxID=3368622 RepID=UPI003BA14681
MIISAIVASVRRELDGKGWSFIEGGESSVFDQVTDTLANKLYDSDIRLDDRFPHMVSKPAAIAFHCDSPRARYIAWLCIASGERSVPLKLVDTWSVLAKMDEDTVATLAATRLGFNCRITEKLCSMPIVSKNAADDEIIVFFNRLNAPKNLSERQRQAVADFTSSVDRAEAVEINFRSNDILIVKNHRIVHGRDALDEVSNRHLVRRLLDDPSVSLPIKFVRASNVVTTH